MNKLIKFGIASLTMAVAVSTFADEQVEDEGAVGWTPIAFGIASPVQLPWGHAKWDVFGLDFNALYSGSPKMYGLGIAGLGNYMTDDVKGLEVSGLMNWNRRNTYGASITLGANICNGTSYGFNAGGFGYSEDFWGVDVEFLGAMRNNVWGWQIGGLANVVKAQSYGWELAVGVNIADVAYGCQTAGIFNMAQELHGCQIGLVNFAERCPWGFQIGIVNIIMDNTIKVLPIVNGYF